MEVTLTRQEQQQPKDDMTTRQYDKEEEAGMLVIPRSETNETVPSFDEEYCCEPPENDDFPTRAPIAIRATTATATDKSIDLSLTHDYDHTSYFQTSSPMTTKHNFPFLKKKPIIMNTPPPPITTTTTSIQQPKRFKNTTASSSSPSKPPPPPSSQHQMFAPNDSIYEMNTSMMSMDDLQYVEQSFEHYDKESVVNSGYAASVSALSHSEWSVSGFDDSQLSSYNGGVAGVSTAGDGAGTNGTGTGGSNRMEQDVHDEEAGNLTSKIIVERADAATATAAAQETVVGALTTMLPSQRILSQVHTHTHTHTLNRREAAELSSDLSTNTISFSVLRRARERRRKHRFHKEKKREAALLLEFRKFMGWNSTQNRSNDNHDHNHNHRINNNEGREDEVERTREEQLDANDEHMIDTTGQELNVSMDVVAHHTDSLPQHDQQEASGLDRMLSPQFRSMIPWVVVNGNEKEEDLSTLNGSKFNDSNSYHTSRREHEDCIIEDWNRHADSRFRNNRRSPLKPKMHGDYTERFYISIILIAATIVIAMIIVVVLEMV